MNISDQYCETGSDFQKFEEKVKEMADSTEVIKYPKKKCEILSVFDLAGKKALISLTPEKPVKVNKRSATLKLIKYDRDLFVKKYSEQVIDETESLGFYLCFTKHKDKALPVSTLAINSIQNRTCLGGPSFGVSSLGRNLSIAENLSSDDDLSIVCRSDESTGEKKIFALMSKDYQLIDQKIIKDVIEKLMAEKIEGLGYPICDMWEINHEITRIYLTFPESAAELMETYKLPDTMTPGIMIETSDIGLCSFRIMGYFKFHGSLFFTKENFSKIHSGDISVANIMDAAEKIFPKFTVYPEKLMNLLAIDVAPTEMPAEERRETIHSVIDDILNSTEIAKMLGKKRRKALNDEIDKWIAESNPVTAYDIAEFIMSLDTFDTVSQSKQLQRNIQVASVGVLDYDFSEFI